MTVDFNNWQPAHTDFYYNPFPHIVSNEILPTDLIPEINNNWPNPDSFTPEVPGNYVLYLPQKIAGNLKIKNENFWQGFLDNTYIPLCNSIKRLYAPIIERRYSAAFKDISFASICLMESELDYPGHPLHTHHYHDPTWLCSNFIYLDDADTNARGTTLYGLKGNVCLDRQAQIAAHSFMWESEADMIKFKEVPFQRNQLLSFVDGPTSYHGVEKSNTISDPLPRRGRRLIRCHIQLDPLKFIPMLYGVSPEEYKKTLLHLNIVNGYHVETGRDIVEWAKKDITEIYTKPVFKPSR